MGFYVFWLESTLRLQNALLENFRQGLLVGADVARQFADVSEGYYGVLLPRKRIYHAEGNVLFINRTASSFSARPALGAKIYQLFPKKE